MNPTERIDALLAERGMSRRQLAMQANIPPSSFQSAMSRGKNMTIEMLQSVADALDVPIEALLPEESETQHYAKLDDTYYRGVITWTENEFFSPSETATLKMHFAELMLRYKKMVESLVSYKINNSQIFDSMESVELNGTAPLSPQEVIKFHLSQEIEKELVDLKKWIDAMPMYFSNAVFESEKTAPDAANIESGEGDQDH